MVYAYSMLNAQITLYFTFFMSFFILQLLVLSFYEILQQCFYPVILGVSFVKKNIIWYFYFPIFINLNYFNIVIAMIFNTPFSSLKHEIFMHWSKDSLTNTSIMFNKDTYQFFVHRFILTVLSARVGKFL